jgi:outer membrane protein OmpA-like peptidoglycan-associated protein
MRGFKKENKIQYIYRCLSIALLVFCVFVTNGQQSLVIEGRVTDTATSKAVSGVIVTLRASDTTVTIKTDETGKYRFTSPLLKPNKIYVVYAGNDNPMYGYAGEDEYYASTYGLDSISRTYVRNISLKQGVMNTQVQTPDRHVQFIFRYNTLNSPEKDTALNIWLQYLKSNPTYIVEINGYADRKEGDKSLRMMLSRARAQQCINYLMANGILQNRLRLMGNGTNNPVMDRKAIRKIKGKAAKLAARQLNCRAEIVLKNIFFPPPLVINVSGMVTNVNSNEPMPHALILLSGSEGTHFSTETDSLGHYRATIKNYNPLSYYEETCETPGYNSAGDIDDVFKITPQSKDETVYVHNFRIEKNGIQKPLIFSAILFDSGSIKLTRVAIDSLNSVKKLLLKEPGLVLEFMGDADWHENDYVQLASSRAHVCVNYLVSQGIDTGRFVAASRINEDGEVDKEKNTTAIVKKKERQKLFNTRKCNASFWVLRWNYVKDAAQ